MKLLSRTPFFLAIVCVCFPPTNSFTTNKVPTTAINSKRAVTPFSPSRMAKEDSQNNKPSPNPRPPTEEGTERLFFIAGSFVALALLGSILTSNPAEFDLDTFFALNKVLDFSSQEIEGNIVELPPLSPAEQIVAAFFGPPSGR